MSCNSHRKRHRQLRTQNKLNHIEPKRLAPLCTVGANRLDHIDAAKDSIFDYIAFSKPTLYS